MQKSRFFGLVVGMLVLGAMIFVPNLEAAEKGPIKIGFIAPTTGNFAKMGLEMVEGAKMLLEENNYTVAGRKIELIVEDEGGSPDTAVTKTRKLIKQDKVPLVAGVFATNSGYAVAPVCIEAKIPLFITLSAGDDLTQRKSSPWVNRLSITGCEVGHLGGEYAYKELGWRKAITIGLDYGWGHESSGGFHKAFEELGGKVIQKLWPPVNTMDFGPYVANMDREADGIWDVVSGAATIRLTKSMRESGILNKVGILTGGSTVDEAMLPAMGDDALGILSIFNYSGALDTPLNNKFKELCKKKLNKEATWSLQTSWVGLGWVLRAIQSVNGNVEDHEKLAKALRSVKMEDSIRGPLRMDDYGHPIQTYYVRKVEKVGNIAQNTVIKTFPNVTQFWKFEPKVYMQNPVYGRTYPECKSCK